MVGRNRCYMEKIKKGFVKMPGGRIDIAGTTFSKRLMLSVPLTGLVRAEWMLGRYSQVVPCNWSQAELFQWMDNYSPLGFTVADARNMSVRTFIQDKFEWLFFIDHDVILPPNTFVWLNEMMVKGDVPIFGGIYFTKSQPSEPLIYRGNGTGYYSKWKFGDKVWVDGMGLGCHMIHGSIIKAAWDIAPEYKIGPEVVRKVFETPGTMTYDAEKKSWASVTGTEDLHFYWRLKREGLLEKAGWPKYQKKEYPYLCDTNIFCKHIDNAGIQYPAAGEEQVFMKDKK
jgi:hypothetical protein